MLSSYLFCSVSELVVNVTIVNGAPTVTIFGTVLIVGQVMWVLALCSLI